jgi:alkanesulfonate monooxygenase SsuD/methylene tetrahydromethanopterin reductase-like flavin-dependent oxidoreductase (luciferase family)
MTNIELGLDTFGDVTADAEGRPFPQARVLRDVIVEAELADRVGVDFFGVGEHHRPDFAISAPEVLLAAIAGRTQRLRLGTAVTVLSSDDPIRVYQRFSTLNAVSNGRAEVILGPTTSSSRRSSRSSRRSGTPTGPASRSAGREPFARRSTASGSSRRSSARRSAPGSASAAARSRWFAPPVTAFR